MDSPDYNALIALLPEKYRAAAVAALQLIGALLAAFSVLVPLIEKFVKSTPSTTDDAYWSKIRRVREMLSVFPRVVIPRLSQAPTKPAPAPARAAFELDAPKLQITWPDDDRLVELRKK